LPDFAFSFRLFCFSGIAFFEPGLSLTSLAGFPLTGFALAFDGLVFSGFV